MASVGSHNACGEFTIESIELPVRGTRVVLHLEDDAHEYADAWKIRSLVKRYSDHIGFSVRLPKNPASEQETAEREVVNSAQALLDPARSEIKDEEYSEFYQTVSRDFAAPLAWSHNRVEGKREYTTLLYVPSHAPFDLWNAGRLAGPQALCKARLHPRRRRAVPAAVSAIREGRGGLQRPAVERARVILLQQVFRKL
jgi:molecular chaperone HtpG